MASVGALTGNTTISIPLASLPFATPGTCGDDARTQHPLAGVPLQRWGTHPANGRNGAAVSKVGVRNLVTHASEGDVSTTVSCEVQPHGSCTLLLSPIE